MWDYTNSVMDHFKNPRNVGKLENANGIGEVGSLACGDALKLFLKINPDNEKIEDAKFQTFGCASAIASASALTELVKGKTLKEAKALTNADIAKFLGGLPEQKMHCSVMGQEALEAAIANYKGEDVQAHEDAKVTCKCFWVEEEKIKEVILENKLTTVEEVTHYTKAGGGCGGCIPDIKKLLAELNGGNKSLSEESSKKMTNIQKFKLISETIEKDIAPKLKIDGGDIELLDIVGNDVIVKLQGACAGCAGARATLKNLVQETLRSNVSQDLNVVEG